ncbi:MAG: LamG domain-containing protein [Microscillaceae bacterium]|nr:LamG domain-containing protein [Microscillaceae bacterium]
MPNDLPLEIGRDVPGITEFFAGVMDEVRLYNRPLGPEEIQQLYEDDAEQKVAFNPCGETRPASIPELGKVEVQQEIVVSQSKIKVYYFDHEQEDGDIVSLWFDGQWVLERQKN